MSHKGFWDTAVQLPQRHVTLPTAQLSITDATNFSPEVYKMTLTSCETSSTPFPWFVIRLVFLQFKN